MASLRSVLWEAWNASIGIEISVSDTAAFKRKFYAERAKAREEGITEFDSLQLISPPIDIADKLWIVRIYNDDNKK